MSLFIFKRKRSVSTDTKICTSCGRTIEYRKKWERNWDQIKYCSDECRRNKQKFDYSGKIMELLDHRDPSATICPSEVLQEHEKSNKELMEKVRRSARLLAHEGKIIITQKGKRVDPEDFRGPIRLKKVHT